jgi:hypothetical protein
MTEHVRLTGRVVVPPMLVEAATSLFIVGQCRPGVESLVAGSIRGVLAAWWLS